MQSFNSPESVSDILVNKIGVEKCNLNFFRLVILGILAGVYIAFGAQLSTRIMAGVEEFGLQVFLGGAAFSIGLMLVVIAGAELFTGNSLILMSVLGGKVKFLTMIKYWVIVYFSNFAGSLIIVFFMHFSGLNSSPNLVQEKVVEIALMKSSLPFWQIFVRGILCNWLVCLAVWMALASNDIGGKILGIFFPIMAFVASGYEHSVANMYILPVGKLLESSITFTGIANNLVASTIGNIFGGAGFVATVYYLVYIKLSDKK